MTDSAYDRLMEAVRDEFAADIVEAFQYELPFPANDNQPVNWLDIPFPAGWEASC